MSTPSTASQESLRAKLREIGYDMCLVSDLKSALMNLEGAQQPVVLVDVSVPELQGVEICREIRNRYKDIKIIALNQSERSLHDAALSAGADVVLDEPIIWPELYMWLQAPRAANGSLLASGAIFGSTPEDVLGSVALLAHDLKSPITVVISSLQTLLSLFEEEDVPALNIKLLKGALYSAYRQMYLVSDMIDLARLELDNYELQPVQFDLVPFIRECVEEDQYALDTKGLVVHLDLPDLPAWVDADTDLMRRALNALIDNTLKFTVRGDDLWIAVEIHDSQVEVHFRDTGRPIRPGFEQSM
ncbi:MAG: response regulator, partial [Anaerolineae bacterium]|nr:response regulator [Anaerolineae bacterium]